MQLRRFNLCLSLVAASSLIALPVFAEWSAPENLGTNVNTSDDEYSGVLDSAQGVLYFDSSRPSGVGGYDIFKSTLAGETWGPAQTLVGGVNTTGDDYTPSISADGSTLYFMGGNFDIYESNDLGASWSARQKVNEVSTGSDEWAPAVSMGTQTMVLTAHDRPGGLGGHDIWFATWNGSSWNAPVNPGAPINTSGDEYAGSLTVAGDKLYLARDGDLFVSDFDGTWQAPVELTELNTDYYETRPMISADGNMLIFSSERPFGEGGYDLYSSVNLPTVDAPDETLPSISGLGPAAPNPFRAESTLRLSLSHSQDVLIEVFDLSGKRVRSIQNGRLDAGHRGVNWDGKADDGLQLPAGAYLIRAAGEDWTESRKVVVLR